MSSELESEGIVAAAVMVPIGIALGAGWLAWQGGKLLFEANKSVDGQIAEKKRQLEEANMHRKRSALAAHNQLVDMCTQVLSQVDKNSATSSVIDFAQLDQLRAELHSICNEAIPDDVIQIESLNSLGFLKLEKIVAKQQHLSTLQLEGNSSSLYRGLSLADLMLDMKIALSAMNIQATRAQDVKAADPIVLERVKLNDKLANVTDQIMAALAHVAELSSDYGLSESSSAWFHSCFNGIDEQIEKLYMPLTSNIELKKGIKRLESLLEQYNMLIPTIESDQKKFAALYQVYADAAKALGEPIEKIKHFKNSKELEDTLLLFKKRAKKAQECAEIYQKLGHAAYICYALDQELQSLGYAVHTRKDIVEMSRHTPQHALLGENKLPFYNWTEDDLTQLYSMTSECSLQLIVHADGAVTMQTLSDADNSKAKTVQSNHCSLMKQLHENLKKNWFVMYDYHENASPDEITSIEEWFGSEDITWEPAKNDLIVEQRKKERYETRTQQSQ